MLPESTKTQTDATADWSGDSAIGKIQLGVIDGGLVRLYRAIELAHGGCWVSSCCLGMTPSLNSNLNRSRLTSASCCWPIFGKLALGLFELHLIRTRIDFRQDVTCFDDLAFFKGDVDELPVDSRAHRNCVEAIHAAQAIVENREIALG